MPRAPGRNVSSASSLSSRMELRVAPSSSSPVSARLAEKSTIARSPCCRPRSATTCGGADEERRAGSAGGCGWARGGRSQQAQQAPGPASCNRSRSASGPAVRRPAGAEGARLQLGLALAQRQQLLLHRRRVARLIARGLNRHLAGARAGGRAVGQRGVKLCRRVPSRTRLAARGADRVAAALRGCAPGAWHEHRLAAKRRALARAPSAGAAEARLQLAVRGLPGQGRHRIKTDGEAEPAVQAAQAGCGREEQG